MLDNPAIVTKLFWAGLVCLVILLVGLFVLASYAFAPSDLSEEDHRKWEEYVRTDETESGDQVSQ